MSREQQQKLFDGITHIRDDLIEQAQNEKLQASHWAWQRWVAIAAGVLIVMGLGGSWLWHQRGSANNAGSGGTGHMDGTVFMSYAGPIFPLTLMSQRDEITARRSIAYDFTPSDEQNSDRVWGAGVKDTYVLTNHSNQAHTVNALYPFAGSFRDLPKQLPSIAVKNVLIEATLYAGAYSGVFQGTGPNDPSQSLNLKGLDSWEGYKALLESGAYQRQALSPYPELNQKVTVYEFSDFKAPLEDYPAATQAISFQIDTEKTTILQYGFEGMEWDGAGYRRYSYFVPDGISMRSECKVLIVIGEDIGSYALEGYKNGACEKGNELDGVSATVSRYETVLSDVLESLVKGYLTQYRMNSFEEGAILEEAPEEMVMGAIAQLLNQYGVLGSEVAERYEHGRLEDLISDTIAHKRLFYLAFPLTIPAGGSVSVSAELLKEPSFDFYCSGSENVGLQGYDMVTRLASNLRFEIQTAEVVNTEGIEIARQNFGFDLPGGVTQVTLDADQEHYYMEIRAVKQHE